MKYETNFKSKKAIDMATGKICLECQFSLPLEPLQDQATIKGTDVAIECVAEIVKQDFITLLKQINKK